MVSNGRADESFPRFLIDFRLWLYHVSKRLRSNVWPELSGASLAAASAAAERQCASRDAANLNIRCRNCKNPPRTRSNSAAPRSSNRVHVTSPDEEHSNANVREIGFSRRRLCAGPRRRSAGAGRRHGLSRGAGRTGLPGAAARLLRAAAGTAGLLPAAASRLVWLSAAAGRIRHLRRAALRRGAAAVLRAGAVLARLRAALCLWLRALARPSALVSLKHCEWSAAYYSSVMPGLVPGIHVLLCCKPRRLQTKTAANKDVDGRDEPGHDVRGAFANLYLRIFAGASSMSLD
jgi:hypothetical protein